jgi:mannan polymerase II complex ANP1 subunit
MERERIAQEAEEKERGAKAKKIEEEFGDSKGQWEKDKSEMQNLALKEKVGGDAVAGEGAAAGPKEKPEKDENVKKS